MDTATYTVVTAVPQNTFKFSRRFMHAKIGLFTTYSGFMVGSEGYLCVGDANHTPAVSMRAGMEVCIYASVM